MCSGSRCWGHFLVVVTENQIGDVMEIAIMCRYIARFYPGLLILSDILISPGSDIEQDYVLGALFYERS